MATVQGEGAQIVGGKSENLKWDLGQWRLQDLYHELYIIWYPRKSLS